MSASQHAVFHVLEADNGGPARVVDFTIFGLVLISAVNLAVGNAQLEFAFISVFAAEYLIRLWWHRLAPGTIAGAVGRPG